MIIDKEAKKAILVLEDGSIYKGWSLSDSSTVYGEIVFNTGMTGYQEILTDPSYCGQSVVMTYPMIGNYGINDDDMESRQCFLDAIIVREYVDQISNWRASKTLKTFCLKRLDKTLKQKMKVSY